MASACSAGAPAARPNPVAATKTSSRLARTSVDVRCDRASRSRCSDAFGGLARRRIEQHVQPRAELRHAEHGIVLRAAHGAPRRCPSASTSTTAAGNVGHQSLRRALRDDPAAREDRELVAALGFVHVVRRHEDRHAARDQLEQALPEVAATLRIDRAGGLVEQQQFGLVQRRCREREPLRWPPLSVPARCLNSDRQVELCRRRSAMRVRAGARGRP